MKILHVLSQRPDSTGSGIYLQALLRESHNCGHMNSLIAGINSGSSPPSELTGCDKVNYVLFNSDQIPFIIPGMSDVMPYPSSKFSDLSKNQINSYCTAFRKTLESMIYSSNPDILHTHHLWLLSSLVKINFPEIPMVTSCHGSDLRQFQLCPHLQHKVLEGCRNINRILALSRAQKVEICSGYHIPPEQVEVVGAGFNDTVFYPAEKPPAVPLELLYCGKLSRSKGVPYLLQAMLEIPEDLFHLNLVGEGVGPERRECISLADRLGKKVTVHGTMQQPELADLMRRCHIFILPSLFEGLPLVILEALACNCHVITTNLPGCQEIVETSQTGRVTLIDLPRLATTDQLEPGEKGPFIDRIKKSLLAITKEYERDNSFTPENMEDISSFTWNQVFKRIEKIYKEFS